MKKKLLGPCALTVALSMSMFAQSQQRQATMVGGGGGPDRGKCTLEVVVDGVAQVEIRGASATLRTTSGQPAQWRRFECSSAMPSNPVNFRFQGVDGRGRQDMVRDPRNGGVAVVVIEDKSGGREGYTFDIFWGGGDGNNFQDRDRQDRDRNRDPRVQANPNRDDDDFYGGDQYQPNYRSSEYFRRWGHGFGTNEAIRVCQQAVSQQAARRFRRARDIHFARTAIDNNPGRNDWVVGAVDIHRGAIVERYRFSCSVNFDSGVVRSATLDAVPVGAAGTRR